MKEEQRVEEFGFSWKGQWIALSECDRDLIGFPWYIRGKSVVEMYKWIDGKRRSVYLKELIAGRIMGRPITFEEMVLCKNENVFDFRRENLAIHVRPVLRTHVRKNSRPKVSPGGVLKLSPEDQDQEGYLWHLVSKRDLGRRVREPETHYVFLKRVVGIRFYGKTAVENGLLFYKNGDPYDCRRENLGLKRVKRKKEKEIHNGYDIK